MRILLPSPPLFLLLALNLYLYQDYVLRIARSLQLSQAWEVVLIVAPVIVVWTLTTGWLAASYRYMWSVALRIPDGALAWRARVLVWAWTLLGLTTLLGLAWFAYLVVIGLPPPQVLGMCGSAAGLIAVFLLLWSVKVLARMHIRLRDVARQIEAR